MKRIFYYLSLLAAITLVTSCEFEEPKEFVPDNEDETGNLLINNNSSERLVLYVDEYPVKKIPSTMTDYVVNIETTQGEIVELDLYKWDDVKDNINNPDPQLVWKKWVVPLSESTQLAQRVTWSVNGKSDDVDVATLKLSYYGGGPDYYVNVFLDGEERAKLASLKPGDQYVTVGVEYGMYTMSYEYWTSNQHDNAGTEIVGTIETAKFNGEEIPIWLVLNKESQVASIIVPHHDEIINMDDKYGKITITNMSPSGEPVIINADGTKIEDICVLEDGGSAKGLSNIQHGKAISYFLPISNMETLKQSYVFKAYNPGGSMLEMATIEIAQDKAAEWLVDGKDDVVVSDTTAVQ
ncbi:MAG: hypothetical protein MI922_19770 [Bacteroidales bacterium]|nr:hypothetical protein [Bacteroidales bacterium]